VNVANNRGGNSESYESARLLAGVLVDNVQQFVVHRVPLFLRSGTNSVGSAMSEMVPHGARATARSASCADES
jgi:hypothetical protein